MTATEASTRHAAYLRRGALAMATVAIGGYLVDYGYNLGLTRFLEPESYGDFKVAFSFAYLFGFVLLLGGDRAAPMVLSSCLERGEPRRVWEYLRFYLGSAGLLGLGLIAVTWTLSFLQVGSSDPYDHHPLAWAVVATPLNAAAAMVSRTVQAAKLPAQAVVPWRLGLPLLQLLLFALVIPLRGDLTAHEAIAIGMVATGSILSWQWVQVRRRGLVELARDPIFREPRVWLAASLPMAGTFLVALALNQSDLYFLELLGDEAHVGHYAAAAMVAHFLPLAQVTLVGLVAPIARPAIEAGAASSRDTYRQALRLMLLWLVPIVLVLTAAGEPILALFGPRYRVGHATLLFLVGGNFSWACAALSSLWLQYRGRGGVVLVISISTLVLDSGLNLLLIPRYGMNGAAAGTALTLTLAAVAVVLVHLRSEGPAPQHTR